jgi:hypothetical protein
VPQAATSIWRPPTKRRCRWWKTRARKNRASAAPCASPGSTTTSRTSWTTAKPDEAIGTWTGLACPDHGLQVGDDVNNATLLRLDGQGEVADLVWEPPAELAAEHGQLCVAAIQAHLSGRIEEGEHLWEQVVAVWSHAWAANYKVLELMQNAGLTRFSPAKPQQWVIASFGHHTGPGWWSGAAPDCRRSGFRIKDHVQGWPCRYLRSSLLPLSPQSPGRHGRALPAGARGQRVQ